MVFHIPSIMDSTMTVKVSLHQAQHRLPELLDRVVTAGEEYVSSVTAKIVRYS